MWVIKRKWIACFSFENLNGMKCRMLFCLGLKSCPFWVLCFWHVAFSRPKNGLPWAAVRRPQKRRIGPLLKWLLGSPRKMPWRTPARRSPMREGWAAGQAKNQTARAKRRGGRPARAKKRPALPRARKNRGGGGARRTPCWGASLWTARLGRRKSRLTCAAFCFAVSGYLSAQKRNREQPRVRRNAFIFFLVFALNITFKS